jgi:hypothetical protein
MKNWRKKLQEPQTGPAVVNTFRVNIGGRHTLVPAVKMRQVRECVRKQYGVFVFFHGNSAFKIKRVKCSGD